MDQGVFLSLRADAVNPQNLLLAGYITYILVMDLVILLDNKPAQSTLAWLLAVHMLPFVSLPAYLMAGVNWRKVRIVRQRPEEILRRYCHRGAPEPDISAHMPAAVPHIQLLRHSNGSRLTLGNRTQLYHRGADFFEALKADLLAAREFIHMESFIWKSDELGRELGEILAAKAREGVKVRVLVDRIGCLFRISWAYRRRLRQAGVEFRYFMSFSKPISSLLSNYLNHRKIIVIDRDISYTGGNNIGSEYITGGKRFASWRDTHLRIKGEASSQLQAIFVTDWYNTTRQWLAKGHYFTDWDTRLDPGDVPIQLVVSGPDSDWAAIRDLYVSLIGKAGSRLWIQSPYFIPDEITLLSMTLAARSGVDLRLMMTGVPDKRIPFWAAHTYFEPLLRAGVKIYQYQAGFLHAKVVICDQEIATVGTCNLDIRAFVLNYEVNAVFYARAIATELSQAFERDLADCREITLGDLRRQGPLRRVRNSILRLLSPLL